MISPMAIAPDYAISALAADMTQPVDSVLMPRCLSLNRQIGRDPHLPLVFSRLLLGYHLSGMSSVRLIDHHAIAIIGDDLFSQPPT
jgi:hypothetical protein